MAMPPPSDRGRRSGVDSRADREAFDAATANTDKAEKLQLGSLRRSARARGLELRSSASGYSLVEKDRTRVDGRNDLTLAEVARYLSAPR
jgi:hypothetical protein